MKFDVPAYVIGGGMTGLAVARNLGRQGIPVYCVLEKREAVSYSRFCRKCYFVKDIQKSADVLKDFFLSSGKTKDGGVLIPVTDLHCLHLSEWKDELEKYFKVTIPKKEVTQTLVEKKIFYKSVSDLDIPHPFTIFPKNVEDIKAMSGKLKYPVFVKPSISQYFAHFFSGKGFIANSSSDLLKYYNLASRNNVDVMVQEIIPGPCENVFGIGGYFDVHHHPRGLVGYHRLRGWPKGFGNSSLIESFPISNLGLVKDITVRYLQQIGYSGIFESEFKLDPRDGVPKLIEINARSWNQISLTTRCGINIVMMAYLYAIDKPVDYDQKYENGLKWINFFKDIASARADGMSFINWMNSLKNLKELSYFAIDDILPWISNFNEMKRNMCEAIHIDQELSVKC